MRKSDKLKTITLTMDPDRYQKLRDTAKMTKLSMSEINRIALDRLWEALGDLKKPTPEAIKILFPEMG
jgi:hypothetical protein